MTITRRLIVDRKGTLVPFAFKEVKIGNQSVFVKETLWVDGKIPEAQLQALTTFFMSDEVQDELMDLPLDAVLVKRLHENVNDYSMGPFGTDYWIR